MKRNLTSAVFIGHDSLLMHCAEAWLDAGHAVRAVVSAQPEIVQWAQSRGVEVFADEASLLRQSERTFGHLFCIGSPCGVARELVARSQGLALAFHDALLPRYAGWHAPAWALMAQEAAHGVTWHEMTPGNAGGIVRQARFDVAEGETALSLQARCYEAGLQSFKALVQDMDSGALVLGEAMQPGAYLDRRHRPPTLGTLDFSRPAQELAALVAALDFGLQANPLARAKLYLGERLLLVGSARALPASCGAVPGTVLQADADSLRVACAGGEIELGGFSAPWGMLPGHGLRAGMRLPPLEDAKRAQLAVRAPEIGQGELFWRKALATLAPVELPYPRQTAVPGAGAGARQLGRARLQLAARGAATVAAFLGWLSALTAQERISVLYCDRALQADSAGLECWLSPWVPLTLRTAPDSPAPQAQAQAQAQIERLHQAGALPRDLPTRLGGKPDAGERWARVGICLEGAAPAPAGTELLLTIDPVDGYLQLVADTAVFSPSTLQAMASHLAVYLKAFEGADCLASIPLVPEAEAALLARLNATATPYDADLGIHEAIALQAARTPHAAAVSFRGQTLTYRELHAQAGALAERLRASGVRPGDVVGLCLERGLDLVAGVLAILATGAAYLPLDPEYPHDRLLYMIEDSGAPLVLTSGPVAARLGIPDEKVFLVHPGKDEAGPVRVRPDAPGRARRAAYLIYTSGSTGRPKGVVVTHRNVLNFFAGLNARIPHQAGGRWLAVTSVCFDISVVELLWTLTHGFAIVLHSNALPYVSVADALLQGQATHLQCTPSMASMLVSDAAGRQALSGLSVLMVGGEALSMKLAGELRALVPGSFFNMYGPTETTVWSTACDLAQLGDFVPLGQPIANTQLAIRTPGGAPCPALVAGELLIGGDGVSDGYWQRPELNAERFPVDAGARWYRTGDLARRHPDGTLEFLGRIDHQVKIRGHRIELGEIESVLLRQSGVKEAVVIAREDAAGDWSLAAYVTPQAGAVLQTEDLRRGVAGKLPDIMVPRAIAVLRAFPLTPNGKVDRRALLPVRAPAAGPDPSRPLGPLASALAAAWAEVLGQPDIGPQDNFFELGGNFFLAVQVQRRLHEACGRRIGLGDMARWPVLGELAAQLDADGPASTRATGLNGPALADAARPAALPAPGAAGLAAPAALPGAAPGQAPAEALEPAIARMWRELLGMGQVRPEDDFFALGGHSLTAVRLFAQIRQQFAVDLPLATLFQAPTLASFTETIARHRALADSAAAPGAGAPANAAPEAAEWSPMVRICAGRPERAPLFCIHGAGGNVLNFKPLSVALGPDQPVYALQAQGVDGRLEPLDSIEAMAAQYVRAIREVEPSGPYRLIGYSAGGLIAFEVAQQLRQGGAEVSLLGMLDSISPTRRGKKISLLKKAWLMRHWSLGYILERKQQLRRIRRLELDHEQALARRAPGETMAPELFGYRLFNQLAAAAERYRPQPYSGPVMVFRATQKAEIPFLNAGSRLGWEDLVRGPIRVVDIPSSHDTLLNDPGLQSVAQALERELARSALAPVAQGAPERLRSLPQAGAAGASMA